MSSDDSDIELKSALNKKTKNKTPKSPSMEILRNGDDPKKISTKIMIRQALTDLKPIHSRKGVSIQAIKKYIQEKYHYDIEKYNYLIKKYLKSAVEAGMVLQIKGIGASGSFRLANIKEKTEKKKKKKMELDKPEKEKDEGKAKKLKEKKQKLIKPKKSKTKEIASKDKKVKKSESKDKETTPKKVKTNPGKEKMNKNMKQVNEKTEKVRKDVIEKEKSTKTMKQMKTPAKKRAAMMRRKSIGSIIKKPKMKPKAK